MRAFLVLMVAVLTAAILVACGAQRPQVRSPGQSLVLSKCGACHLRPEPGTLDREFLAEILTVGHRSRVPMSDVQRGALLDYLAPLTASGSTARAHEARALP